ncbi:OST-HTH/LOTUS domain-containing protein [Fluviicoccus keumensis]|uniref:OST-HTH/LOTUS domain-containing protein n=1 Tax=Fluviicoccus keumensis TaxID=1435465 RepID=A0A4V2G6C9_9GAMM|nr:NYN domain-containing protein [Fluviicoccus keumensis]RZU48176.1 OST-HTH/LOTUS domain-containing protein [Fluviicoccus keumensis]
MPILQGLLQLARPALARINQKIQQRLNSPDQPRLAVLIDAENMPTRGLDLLMEQVHRWGQPVLIRAYADWANSSVSAWKVACRTLPIQTVQQHSYVKGKSTSDMAMIIDAMDLLYSKPLLDGFCLISGDSDFAPLAVRLRQQGKQVFAIASRDNAPCLRGVCQHFTTLAALEAKPAVKTPPSATPTAPGKITKFTSDKKPAGKMDISQDRALNALLRDAYEKLPKEEAVWVDMTKFDTSARSHAYYLTIRKEFSNLTQMYQALGYLELGRRAEKPSQYFIRLNAPEQTVAVPPSPAKPAREDKRQALFDRISALARVHADDQLRISPTALYDALMLLMPSFDPKNFGYVTWEGVVMDHPELVECKGPGSRFKHMLILRPQERTPLPQETHDEQIRQAIRLFQRPDHWGLSADVLRYLTHPLTHHRWPEDSARELLCSLPSVTTASDVNRREILVGISDDPLRAQPRAFSANNKPDLSLTGLYEVIAMAVAFRADSDGWMLMADTMTEIQRRYPQFTTRIYGFNGLRKLIDADGQFETLSRNGHAWVRLRSRKAPAQERQVEAAQAA